jgi:hypothetical protein
MQIVNIPARRLPQKNDPAIEPSCARIRFQSLPTLPRAAGGTPISGLARLSKGRSQTEAALLAFFFCQIGQKIRQRLLPRKLCGSIGLESVSGHLNAQRFALAAHIPAPAIRVLAASGSNDVIVVGVSGHTLY